MQLNVLALAAGLSVSIHIADSFAEEPKCPFPEIYIEIDRSYHECENGYVKKRASCELFLEKIESIFPKYNCKRSFDTAPVPAIWLFGAASEDYIKLVYELASGVDSRFDNQWLKKERARAKEIFLSQGFRSILDGHLAEEYFPLIEKMNENQP